MKYLLFALLFPLSSTIFGQVITLSEDFEDGIPSTWAIQVVDTNTVDTSVSEYANGWIGIDEPIDPTNHVAAATSYFKYVEQAHRLLILPKQTMSGYGNILSWHARSQDPSYPDSYQILISTTDSLATSFTDTIFKIVYEGEFWATREVNLSDSGYVNQDIYIAINLNSINGYKLYIDDVQVRTQDPLGLKEIEETQVVLYPNPATDLLKISADSPVETVSITDLSGKTVISANTSTIDVSGLNPGMYVARIQAAKGLSSKRFVKR